MLFVLGTRIPVERDDVLLRPAVPVRADDERRVVLLLAVFPVLRFFDIWSKMLISPLLLRFLEFLEFFLTLLMAELKKSGSSFSCCGAGLMFLSFADFSFVAVVERGLSAVFSSDSVSPDF